MLEAELEEGRCGRGTVSEPGEGWRQMRVRRVEEERAADHVDF